jgi:hypothetical protein
VRGHDRNDSVARRWARRYGRSVGTIRIEPEPPVKETRCEACGGTNRLLHGYVYEDEHPHGVYFVEWCDGRHPEKAAFLTVGLGAFGDKSDKRDRAAFCVAWREEGMSLTEEPARDRPELLGDFVPRAEALTLPSIDHFWHVADHIVLDDPRLSAVEEWFEGR